MTVKRRLERLEKATGAKEHTLLVMPRPEETDEEAIARTAAAVGIDPAQVICSLIIRKHEPVAGRHL